MPYIKPYRRRLIGLYQDAKTPGELNYMLTQHCLTFIRQRGTCYDSYNEVIGVLECMKQELYRKAVAPYEEKKIKENGDLQW
jgi:exonuclease I